MFLFFSGLIVLEPVEIVPRKVTAYEVNFTIRNAGLGVDGSFQKLTASMDFDPANLEQSRISATVDVSTVQTGIELRDKHLLGREYFDAARYPVIEIRSKSIKAVSKNKYEGAFTVVIRGIEREMKVPFSVSRKGRGTLFRSEFRISRRDFGVGKESIILSDDVDVAVTIVTGEGSEHGVQ
jgi:polyisoprenoid-binding protein YceI